MSEVEFNDSVTVRAGQPVKAAGVEVSGKEPAVLALRRTAAGWSLGPGGKP